MKKVIMLSVVAFVLSIIACNNAPNKNETSGSANSDPAKTTVANSLDTTKLASGTKFYQCPMDPEEMSDKPASCSKCGMDLEQVVKY